MNEEQKEIEYWVKRERELLILDDLHRVLFKAKLYVDRKKIEELISEVLNPEPIEF